MVSLLPPSVAISGGGGGTTTSFLPKTSQLSIPGKRKPNFISKPVSCKATNGDDQNKFDRRDILLGLGGLYGVSSLNESLAFAKPITGPDFTHCGRPDLPTGAANINCCPPKSTKIVDFVLPPSNAPLRTRPAAHLVNGDYLAKFSKAIELMKALPASDPRSFMQQANVHCAYCDGAYHQLGFPDLDLQVHNSWLFFPFHRFYLYFFEKILGKLIDDPTFAMPFWNWDSPAGMQMPVIYANPNSPLYDKLRNASHKPPTLLDLDYNGIDETLSSKDQISSNLNVMYRQMVSNGKTAKLFLGNAYRAGEEPDPGAGSLENIPHGPVRDCLDTKKLGYEYQNVEIPWIKTKPTPKRVTSKVKRALGVANAAETKKKVNIEFDRHQVVKFDVYINDEDDTVIGPNNTEFAGSFVNVPHKHKHGKKMATFLRLGLTDLLEELDAEDDDGVVVTLVPKFGKGLAKIGGIKIGFARD
ncbi:hypothetical protein GOBAR_AA10696 [Gossypium barbadense]|uniref:Tyrosinase copper-binding domain-containing protein n=1 Tax=Gossypium barbadense TaxID=3634 RepID=A0A2P5Y2Y1_GOSBA|nr:hypothetical protein GOBAR_AA10696 [Gossypium barbadense]